MKIKLKKIIYFNIFLILIISLMSYSLYALDKDDQLNNESIITKTSSLFTEVTTSIQETGETEYETTISTQTSDTIETTSETSYTNGTPTSSEEFVQTKGETTTTVTVPQETITTITQNIDHNLNKVTIPNESLDEEEPPSEEKEEPILEYDLEELMKNTPKGGPVRGNGINQNLSVSELNRDVVWLNFLGPDSRIYDSNGTMIKDYGTTSGNIQLQEGMVFEIRNIIPGEDCIFRGEITSLETFQQSQTMQEYVASGHADPANYQPNLDPIYWHTNAGFMRGQYAPMYARNVDLTYSSLYQSGVNINTGTSFGPTRSGANVGMVMSTALIRNGESSNVPLVIADSEEAARTEFTAYRTNGDGLNLLANIPGPNSTGNWRPLVEDDLKANPARWNRMLYRHFYPDIPGFLNPNPDAGLGTNVFGPALTATTASTPVLYSLNTSEVSMYMITPGGQQGILGLYLPATEYSIGSHLEAIGFANGMYDAWEFELQDMEGTVIDSVTCSDNEDFTFNEVITTRSVGTYQYKIIPKNLDRPNIFWNTQEILVTVTVTRDENLMLHHTIEYSHPRFEIRTRHFPITGSISILFIILIIISLNICIIKLTKNIKEKTT